MKSPARLAAIVCADVVGFGERTAADEDGTLDALAAERERLRDVVHAHNGRVVNTWGDGVIAEFTSISKAVHAAVAFQDAALPNALQWRFGINLADVVHERDDVLGHGVNVTARLQQAALPGGILITDAVYAAIGDRLALSFEPVEPIKGKGSEPPIAAWQIVLGRNHPGRMSAVTSAALTRPDPPTPHTGETRAPIFQIWEAMTRGEKVAATGVAALGAVNIATEPFNPWFLYVAILVGAVIVIRRLLRSGS
ncbi:MAG: adenylate/guanylate cyclase domain-containing protein [Pseudomonadota bacterium]